MQGSNIVRCWTGGGPRNRIWNWGDAISPTLFTLITGEPATVVDYTDLTTEPHWVICGSTLKWITAGSIVWGTGEIAKDVNFVSGQVRPRHVAATRGPLTRARLQAVGIRCPEVYGDPALLFPQFYRASAEKTFDLGVIPHYIDAGLPFLAGLRGRGKVRVIDITQAGRKEKIYAFIDEVLSCRRIVSSSLHGLIVAEAYGIPAMWARFSDNVYGDGFKFNDYHLSVGRDIDRVKHIGAFSEPSEAIGAVDRNYSALGPIAFDPETLLGAFRRTRT